MLLMLIAGCAASVRTDRSGQNMGPSVPPDKNQELKLVFFDVGQGDAALVSSGENMLIDAGPPDAGRNIIIPYLKQNGIDELKYIVATHYHDDHIGGIVEVMRGEDQTSGTADDIIPKEGILDRGGKYEGYSPAYDEYAGVAGTLRNAVHPGDVYDLGGASVEIVAADGEVANGTRIGLDPDDENAASVVLLVTSGDVSFLHASDITGGGGDPPYETADIETEIASTVGEVDILKVAHHGSKTSTNSNFLEMTGPDVAVISVGDGNDFGHPHDEVIDRLIDSGTEVYLTEEGWLDEEYLDSESVHIQNGPITILISEDQWEIDPY